MNAVCRGGGGGHDSGTVGGVFDPEALRGTLIAPRMLRMAFALRICGCNNGLFDGIDEKGEGVVTGPVGTANGFTGRGGGTDG